MTERVLYLVICAAGPANRIDVMVHLARAAGWSVYCLATPAAVEYFLDVPTLTALTGHPVRTTYRTSEDQPLSSSRRHHRGAGYLQHDQQVGRRHRR